MFFKKREQIGLENIIGNLDILPDVIYGPY